MDSFTKRALCLVSVVLFVLAPRAIGDDKKQNEVWASVRALLPELKDKTTFLGKEAERILSELREKNAPILHSDALPFVVALKAQQALIQRLVMSRADTLANDRVATQQLEREEAGVAMSVVERQAQQLKNVAAQQRRNDLQERIQLQENLQKADRLRDGLYRRP